MLGRRDDHQIFRTIVSLVPVLVVHVLGWLQMSAECLRHNQTVNAHVFAINVHAMVAVAIDPTLSMIFRRLQQSMWAAVFMKTAIVFLAVPFAIDVPRAALNRALQVRRFRSNPELRRTGSQQASVVCFAKLATIYRLRAVNVGAFHGVAL
jgi:hypothetical protein